MISLEEAQARLMARATPLPVETVSLGDAAGRWAVEPLVAKRTQPARDLSAMDGYAVAGGTEGLSWTLIGESAAGIPFKEIVSTGCTVRIFTGAALPDGTDAVIMQEDVTRVGDRITVPASLALNPGNHVRAAGSDFRAGDVLIESGTRLTPACIALAAAAGHGMLPVRRRARIAILSTGSELVPAGEDAGEDFLPESNSLMIAAMLADTRCEIANPGIIPDDLDMLAAALGEAARHADVIITLGGASVGDHDLVRPALEVCGAALDFWKVAMRPGKPVLAGMLGETLILGLPGNPVSAYVTAELFLKPLVAALGGAAQPMPRRESAILDGTLAASGPRIDHIRAVRTGGAVKPVGINDSAALRALAAADTLIVRPAHAPLAKVGDRVEVINIA
jgi:molybdopterin molybdotransferase